MTKEIKICCYCKQEIRPLDAHASHIEADSPNDKSFLRVTCILKRYYHAEVEDVNK